MASLSVTAFFRANARGLNAALRQSQALTRGLERAVGGVTQKVATLGTMATTALGIGGVGAMAQLNREIESSRIGLATMLQQASAGGRGPFEDFNRAMERAVSLQQAFRERGAALPGTTKDFEDAFKTLVPIANQAGASVEELLSLAEKSVVAASVGGISGGAATVARDVRQILTGSASLSEISTTALHGGLDTFLKLAKKDKAKALQEITKALAVSDEALGATAASFDAQFATATDTAKQLVATVGAPVFEWVNKQLGIANEWYTKNKARVDEIAKGVGKKIVGGLEKAIQFAKDFAKHWDIIKRVIQDVAIVWIGSKLITALKTASVAFAANPLGALLLAAATGAVVIDVVLNTRTPEDAAKQSGVELPSQIRTRLARGEASPAEAAAIREAHARKFRRGVPAYQKAVRAASMALQALSGQATPRTKEGLDIARAAASLNDRELAAVVGRASAKHVDATKRQIEELASARDAAIEASKAEHARRLQERTEKMERFKKPDKPPYIDARGSTFRIDQRFEDGDPDRVALAVRDAVIRPFVPMLAGQ